jgi:hypothetical protein
MLRCSLVLKALKEPKALRAHKVHKVTSGLRVRKDHRALKAFKALRAHRDHRVTSDLKGRKALRDRKGTFKGPQGSQGPQGDIGPQGTQGPQGAAATIAVGTTSTLAPGSSATVANSGTSSAAVFDFGIPEGVQGPPGLDGTGAPVFGQVAKMTSGTITIATQGVYQSTGLTAVLDGENAGISLGTSDLFAVKNTSGATRRLKISASYDASMAGAAKVLGLALAVNGVVDLDTECRATTGIQGAIAKLATQWIIDLADGDEVALYVANHSSTVDIDFERGRIVATSVAGFGPQGPQGVHGSYRTAA